MEDKNANDERHERIHQVTCKGNKDNAMRLDVLCAHLVLAPLLKEFNRSLREHVPWYAIQPMNESLIVAFIGHVNRALGVPGDACIPGMAGRFFYLFDHVLHKSENKDGVDGWFLCLDVSPDGNDHAPIMFLPMPTFCQSTLPKSLGSQVGGFIEWEVSIQRGFADFMQRLTEEVNE